MKRAILYLRLSAVVDESTSIVRQEKDLRDLADREGWEVVRVLVDDGISGRKVRENAQEALRMLREGDAEVLAVWKLDRWSRQGIKAIGELLSTLDDAPGATFVALRDGLRSDASTFGIISAVLAETARAEAENAALRISSSITHRKLTGRFTGGVPPYGYHSVPAPDGAPGRVLVLTPEEVEIIGEMASRILSGRSISSVARWLNESAIPTPRSEYRRALLKGKPTEGLDRGRWETSTVSVVLTSRHLLGHVTLNGGPVTGDDGLPVVFWPPIVSPATFASIAKIVSDPRVSTRKNKIRSGSRLLSSLVYCSGCHAPMSVHYRDAGKTRNYTCKRHSRFGCPRPVSIHGPHADDIVEEAYLSIVGAFPEMIEETDPDTSARDASLGEIEAAIQETTSALALDGANVSALVARLEHLKGRRAEVLAAPLPSGSRWVATGRTYAEAWELYDLEQRRNLLRSAIDHIVIHPTRYTGMATKGKNAKRVEIIWRPEYPDAEGAA